MSTLDIVKFFLQCRLFKPRIVTSTSHCCTILTCPSTQDVSKKANLQKDWNCPWVSKDGSRLKQAIRSEGLVKHFYDFDVDVY